jgi:hypothetical protein
MADQTLSVTRFKELYARLEREGADSATLLALARDIAKEEERRDAKLRELRDARGGKRRKVAQRESLADLALQA